MRKLILILLILIAPQLANANLDPLTKTIFAIKQHYIAVNDIKPSDLFESAIKQIELDVPEALIDITKRNVIVTVGLAKKVFPAPPTKLYQIPSRLKPIVEFVENHREHYPDEPKVMEAALLGLTESLDPHTNYLPPKVFKEFEIGTQGKFGGLGIVISIRDGGLTVVAPLDGTPASRAGIKSGDKIVQINDESTINMSLTDAVNKLRGKVGTSVNIVIKRPNQDKPIRIKITRAIINIESVQDDVYEYEGNRFAYFKIKSFQSNTLDDFNKALTKMKSKGEVKGVILDFRNDTGGLLNQAIDLSDRFLKKGTIVSTIAARNILAEKAVAKDEPTDIDLPLVVIINEGSASASEIVAGALKFNKRAIVIGHQSFGKGTVQTIFKLNDGGALKITIAEYLAAGLYPIQQYGITPNIRLIGLDLEKEHLSLSEDITTNEGKLEHTLVSKTKAQANPFLTIPYVLPIKKKDDELTYNKKPELKDDFATKIAAEIIANSSGATFEDLKASAEKIYPIISQKEDQKVIAALSKQGVNWKPLNITLSIPSPLDIKYSFTDKNGKPITKIKAGKEFYLELKITNKWTKAIPRVLAVVREPDYAGANEHELAFGYLAPKASITRKTPITFSKILPTQLVELDLIIKSDQTNIRPKKIVDVNLRGEPESQFAFKYEISDKIKTNKKVSLNTEIFNIGKSSTSEDTVAVIYNDCGDSLFIESGRSALKEIKPNTSKKAKFKFHLKDKELPPSCYIKLTIFDPDSLVSATGRLALTMAGVVPPTGIKYSQPTITMEQTPLTTKNSSITIKGILSANTKAKDWILYVNEEKIDYRQNTTDSKELNIIYNVPLKKGRNRITIIGRDEFDITNNKKIIIFRKTK